eukprot:Nk52_evm5s2531 gene=Nk52_evmTU5s2531
MEQENGVESGSAEVESATVYENETSANTFYEDLKATEELCANEEDDFEVNREPAVEGEIGHSATVEDQSMANKDELRRRIQNKKNMKDLHQVGEFPGPKRVKKDSPACREAYFEGEERDDIRSPVHIVPISEVLPGRKGRKMSENSVNNLLKDFESGMQNASLLERPETPKAKVDQDILEFMSILRLSSYPSEDFNAGEYIFRKGDVGTQIYFVFEGIVDILEGDKPVAAIHEGGFFGEMALIYRAPRCASVRASTKCTVFKLEPDEVWHILRSFPELGDKIKSVAENRLRAYRQKYMGAVEESQDFQELPESEIVKLQNKFQSEGVGTNHNAYRTCSSSSQGTVRGKQYPSRSVPNSPPQPHSQPPSQIAASNRPRTYSSGESDRSYHGQHDMRNPQSYPPQYPPRHGYYPIERSRSPVEYHREAQRSDSNPYPPQTLLNRPRGNSGGSEHDVSSYHYGSSRLAPSHRPYPPPNRHPGSDMGYPNRDMPYYPPRDRHYPEYQRNEEHYHTHASYQ